MYTLTSHFTKCLDIYAEMILDKVLQVSFFKKKTLTICIFCVLKLHKNTNRPIN